MPENGCRCELLSCRLLKMVWLVADGRASQASCRLCDCEMCDVCVVMRGVGGMELWRGRLLKDKTKFD